MVSSTKTKKGLESTNQRFCYEDTVTFDICSGPALDPADVMSTTVTPADDMSITVLPAGVVLVYEPRSRKKLFMKSSTQLVASISPKRGDVRAR